MSSNFDFNCNREKLREQMKSLRDLLEDELHNANSEENELLDAINKALQKPKKVSIPRNTKRKLVREEKIPLDNVCPKCCKLVEKHSKWVYNIKLELMVCRKCNNQLLQKDQ